MNFIDFITNFEHFLPILIQEYGAWVYAILFLIIFSETAFVFMFFLPGDSLLLTVGALCSVIEMMHLGYMITLLTVAATLGYIVNYSIGRHFGNRIFEAKSRFIPFARSFAPLAAGSSNMSYGKFLIYNVAGAILWICILLTAGYLFGHALIQVTDLVEN